MELPYHILEFDLLVVSLVLNHFRYCPQGVLLYRYFLNCLVVWFDHLDFDFLSYLLVGLLYHHCLLVDLLMVHPFCLDQPHTMPCLRLSSRLLN